MKILVVDDDLLAAEMTSAILEASGYQTLIAENAIEGLEQIGSNDIALVVSDLNMPLVSGIDFFANCANKAAHYHSSFCPETKQAR